MSNRNEFYDLSDSPIVINDTNVKKPKNSGGGVNVNFKSFFKIIILVAIIAVVYHFGKAWIDEYKRPVVDVEKTYLQTNDRLASTFGSEFIENSSITSGYVAVCGQGAPDNWGTELVILKSTLDGY